MRILLAKMVQDILEWRLDGMFLFGLLTGLAICCIIMNLTAYLIRKYDLTG